MYAQINASCDNSSFDRLGDKYEPKIHTTLKMTDADRYGSGNLKCRHHHQVQVHKKGS